MEEDFLSDFKEIRITQHAISALIFITQKIVSGPYEFYKEKKLNPKEAYTAFNSLENAKFIRLIEEDPKKYVVTPLGLDFLEKQFGDKTKELRIGKREEIYAKIVEISAAFKK